VKVVVRKKDALRAGYVAMPIRFLRSTLTITVTCDSLESAHHDPYPGLRQIMIALNGSEDIGKLFSFQNFRSWFTVSNYIFHVYWAFKVMDSKSLHSSNTSTVSFFDFIGFTRILIRFFLQ
jgi:hypothetical protein